MKSAKLKNWALELCAKLEIISPLAHLSALFTLLLLMFSTSAFAQDTPKPVLAPLPTISPRPNPRAPVYKERVRAPQVARNEEDTPAEKSIATDTKVAVKLCVAEGTVKINGWDRDEVRAYINNGSQVGFSVLQKNDSNQKPAWIKILGYDPQKTRSGNFQECLSGDEIEIDVPRNAGIDFRGQDTSVTIESVNKIRVQNDGGDISVNNISQAIDAQTYQGDITVENSSGPMKLISTNGNIVAFEAKAADFGDTFLAKTSSGAITLQRVTHRQVDAASNSGSVRFNGGFATGGQYTFGTTSGSINLVVSEEVSCRIKAIYGGAFQSEIPLQDIVMPVPTMQPKVLTGNLGKGDANVTLTALSCVIRIRKK